MSAVRLSSGMGLGLSSLLLAGLLAVACRSLVPVAAQPSPAHLPAAASSWSAPSRSTLVYLPRVQIPPSRLLIAAAHIDSILSGEADEAILLWNSGWQAERLAGWSLRAGSRSASFPVETALVLRPGERIWCAARAEAFQSSFGEPPACVWAAAGEPPLVRLSGTLTLANRGGTISLLDPAGRVVDSLVYGSESRPAEGWLGGAAQLYSAGAIAREGQVWQRKRDPVQGQPVDSDQASDWSGHLADLEWGRQVRYPGWLGWDEAQLGRPITVTASAVVTVAVGPAGLYPPLAAAFGAARRTIDLSGYTFEHPELAAALAAAARRGVRVRLLLEGGPAGGISELQRWCMAQIAAAGAEVTYMAAALHAPAGYRPRYRYLHAKYALIDGHLALVGTDNFGWGSMPLPGADEEQLPMGRRGFYLLIDSAAVVDGLARIFAADLAPDRFLDLRPFAEGDPIYGAPRGEVVFPLPTVYGPQGSPFAEPLVAAGPGRYVLISAPENATRADSGLLALIRSAGRGDRIALEQLYVHKYWGEVASNPTADPNPLLSALIGAARRGAQVRLLLDAYFDDARNPRSNQATATYVNGIAEIEGLDFTVRLGNPTGQGIHAKIALLQLGGERWSVVGSLNGSEVSHKLNREVVVMTDLAEVHARLSTVFAWDWERSSP